MAEFPSLPLFTDAYLADTIHLSTREHGAYLLLLITAWRTPDCCLPNDDKLLAKYTRMSIGRWRKMRPNLEQFFTIDDNWNQKRLTKERVYVNKLVQRNTDAANTRWHGKPLKSNGAGNASASSTHMLNGCQSDAPTPIPTPTPKKNPPISPPRKQIGSYSPDEKERKWALQYWERKSRQDISADEQTEQFRDHHLAHGKTMKDWGAAWKTWVRNAVKFTPPQKESENDIDKFFAR